MQCYVAFSFAAYSQTATGNFKLITQEEVNTFLAEYPNVIKVDGFLHIGVINTASNETSDITDLSCFSHLTEVTKELTIAKIPALENLDFLTNLTTVNGLFIDDNDNLNSISGLGNVLTNTADLAICMN